MVKKRSKIHHLEQRGDVWYFVATKNDARYHLRLSANLKEAIGLRDDYLYELRKFGEIISNTTPDDNVPSNEGMLFGEVALVWVEILASKIKQKQVKESTTRDYKSSMNAHFLPRFGNIPIQNISAVDVEDFVMKLECSPKRINNILVPLRDMFKMAKRRGFVQENIMLDVENLKTTTPDIYPLTKEEIQAFLKVVPVQYEPFFATAFFSGMRFGEMAALKWGNVDWNRGLILVREALVYGVEGPPKTKGSIREIDILPPVREALLRQQKITGKGKYVFRDSVGSLMTPDHARNVVWTPALIKAELSYRPMMQTRHTFATLAIDSGEDLGWVQAMLGHSTLQMIYTRYYSWVRKATRNDGSAMMAKLNEVQPESE